MNVRTAVTTVCFLLSFSTVAAAQVKDEPARVTAGSPEDRAFRAIKSETDADKQAAAGLEFEKTFPRSPFLANVHTILVGIYLQKNDPKRMVEFGEKAYKANAQNIAALLALSRGHALGEGHDVAKAQEFARIAVAVLEELRTKPPQGGLTDKQWKDWLKQSDDSVKPWADYVKLLQPPAPAEQPDVKQTDEESTPDLVALP